MARFGTIFQRERRDAVLDNVWESEKTSLATNDASEVLCDVGIVAAVDFGTESIHGLEELVAVLFVSAIFKVVFAALTESECALGDILTVVVVDGRGTNPFVLTEVSDPLTVLYIGDGLTNCPSICQLPPAYSGFSGVSSMFASFTMTCSPSFENSLRRSIRPRSSSFEGWNFPGSGWMIRWEL